MDQVHVLSKRAVKVEAQAMENANTSPNEDKINRKKHEGVKKDEALLLI